MMAANTKLLPFEAAVATSRVPPPLARRRARSARVLDRSSSVTLMSRLTTLRTCEG